MIDSPIVFAAVRKSRARQQYISTPIQETSV